LTASVAEAVPPVPPFVEVTDPVVLTLSPEKVALTFTETAHDPLKGIVPPDRLMLVAPAAAVKVPPQVFVTAGTAATISPFGNESATPTPLKATVFAEGFVNVIVKVVISFTFTIAGEKAFDTFGGATTVKVAVLLAAPAPV
jgi:hypothetical protein